MSSKQDRTYTRTAEALERKYDFSSIGKGSGGDSIKVSQLEQSLSEHITDTNIKFASINEKLEKGAEGVFYDNTLSRLTSDNVQNAIDELDDDVRIMLVNLNNKVDKTIEYYGDMNELVTSGFYRVGTNENLHELLNYGQVIVSRGLDTASQIGVSYHTGKIITRSCNSPDDNPNWTEWVEYATKGDVSGKWELHSEKTGETGVIDLPTTFEELHITLGTASYMYTFNILPSDLTDEAILFRHGFYMASNTYSDAYISVKKTQITGWTVRKEGVVKEATIKVSYK